MSKVEDKQLKTGLPDVETMILAKERDPKDIPRRRMSLPREMRRMLLTWPIFLFRNPGAQFLEVFQLVSHLCLMFCRWNFIGVQPQQLNCFLLSLLALFMSGAHVDLTFSSISASAMPRGVHGSQDPVM